MTELQALRRAEEIVRRILDNGVAMAVFLRNGEVAALPINGNVCSKYLADGLYPLIGIYDECCPVHWLASDLAT